MARAEQHGQRPGVRPRRKASRLRVGDESDHARRGRWLDRRSRFALRGQGAQQPERPRRPFRRVDLLHRPGRGPRAAPGVERAPELDFHGVYRIPPGGGAPVLLLDDFHTPNGICFSPDETLLYVNDSIRMHVRVFDVSTDGSLSSGRVFFVQEGYTPDLERIVAFLQEHGRLEHGLPDGMKADEHGNVYCTGHGGVCVLSPAGALLGIIETPETPANLAWGGEDGRTLFVCATRSLYAVPMRAQGAA